MDWPLAIVILGVLSTFGFVIYRVSVVEIAQAKVVKEVIDKQKTEDKNE